MPNIKALAIVISQRRFESIFLCKSIEVVPILTIGA
jgi:hypothetical protein